MFDFPQNYDPHNFCLIPPNPTRAVCNAQLKITATTLVFNQVAAAEIDYPLYVYLMVSKDAKMLMLVAPSQEVESFLPKNARQPFWESDKRLTRTGEKKNRTNVTFSNKGLAQDIRRKLNWDAKKAKSIRGIRYHEASILYFDLTTAWDSGVKTTKAVTPEHYLDSLPSLDEAFRTMEPVLYALPSGQVEEKDGVIEADAVVVEEDGA